jgi:hypothetical protein
MSEDLRESIARLWESVAEARFFRYLDENDPAWMDNSMKASAERAWRNAVNIRWRPLWDRR